MEIVVILNFRFVCVSDSAQEFCELILIDNLQKTQLLHNIYCHYWQSIGSPQTFAGLKNVEVSSINVLENVFESGKLRLVQ